MQLQLETGDENYIMNCQKSNDSVKEKRQYTGTYTGVVRLEKFKGYLCVHICRVGIAADKCSCASLKALQKSSE
jgi:hypothetical protein